MKKLACSLLTIIILFTISCTIGLGSSVDTEPPSLSIDSKIADKIIRGDFALRGTYSDDGTINEISAVFKRTDTENSGTTQTFTGSFKENAKQRGSGTWTIDIPAKSKPIKDGTYQADVSITDGLGRVTTQTTIFTIDNTPPLIILTRPSTSINSTSSPDTYGQKLSFKGAAAEANNISRMEIQLYTDEACEEKATLEPIVLKNVPISIEIDAANYDVSHSYYVFEGATDKFNLNVSTDGNGQTFYYKLFAYDGAIRYLPEGETATDDDLKGNRAEYFFLQKDIYEAIGQHYSTTELYSIMSNNFTDTNTSRAANAPLYTKVREDLLRTEATKQNETDPVYQRTIGIFTLNPKNNPTYTLTGRSPLSDDGSKDAFDNNENELISGSQLIIEVAPGLDGHLLKDETIKIYTQRRTFNTNGTYSDSAKVYLNQDDYTQTTSGDAYKIILPISRDMGYDIGGYYFVGVEGEDVKGFTIESVANTPYGFKLISSGRIPSIKVDNDYNYRNKVLDFTNTITISSTEAPYTLYRQVVVAGEDYDETGKSNDTDHLKYKPIATITGSNLTYEDKIKIADYTDDKDITVYYKVTDASDQQSIPQSVELKVDNDTITPEIKAPNGRTGTKALTETTQITGRLSDDKSGIAKIFYKFTNEENPGTERGQAGGYTEEEASAGSFAIDRNFVSGITAGENQLCEGKWFFHVYSEDGAGNISAIATREFDIDMEAPVITTTLDASTLSVNTVQKRNKAYTFSFNITESNRLNATNPVVITVKKGSTELASSAYTIKEGTTTKTLSEIVAGKDYTIEIPDQADELYTYTIKVKDFVGKDATVERQIQFDTTPPKAVHEIDDSLKDIYFRIGDYSNDAGDADVGGKYQNGTYGNAITIQIRGYFADTEGGSGINKYYYKTFNNLEVVVDATKNYSSVTAEQPYLVGTGTEAGQIFFKTADILKNYVIAKNTGTFYPLDSLDTKSVEYNILPANKDNTEKNLGGVKVNGDTVTSKGFIQFKKNVISNYKTTIKGFQEGKNFLVLVAEDNVGNTTIDYAEVPEVGTFYCYSLNVDVTTPSIPTKEDDNKFTNIDYTNIDPDVHYYIEGTVSDKSAAENGSSGIASIVFTRDGASGSIKLTNSDLTAPTSTDISAVPNDPTLKHWKVDVKSLLPSNGTAIISAKVTDNAGYELSAPVASITVDRTPPEVMINSPSADAKIGATSLIINGTASDGNGAGLSSDHLKVYYTKSNTLGTSTTAPVSTAFGTDLDEKWVELGEVTSGAIWTFTKPGIESDAPDGENTTLYFIVSAKDNSGTGNIGYSAPRKVTVDRKAPVFVNGKFNGNETTSTDTWLNSRTVNLEGNFTDTISGVEGSGVTSILYKVYETGTDSSLALVKTIPTTDGSYNTNVNLDEDVTNTTFELWAIDKAGNTSDVKTYTVKVDNTTPSLTANYYKKGTDSLAVPGSTVYIKNQTGGTSFVLYGNYNDGSNQSGVKALVFKKNGTTFASNAITVEYSTTAIGMDGTIPADSTYAAYNTSSASSYNSWKASFNLNETARITIEGEDLAGNKATTVSALDVTFDNTAPVLTNLNFTETKDGVTKDVYSSGSGANLTYFTNNSATAGKTFKISGIATDNVGIQSVTLEVETNPTTSPATKLESQTINEPTGNWNFTIGDWSAWTTGATAKVTVKDKAGNNAEKTLTVQFDTTAPTVDSTKFKTPNKDETESPLFKFEGEADCISHSATVSGLDKVEILFTTTSDAPEATATAQATASIADNGSWASTIEFANVSAFNSQGEKWLWVRAYDKAGNASAWTSKSFMYDTKAPTIDFTATTVSDNPSDGSKRNEGFTFKVNVTDTYGVEKVEVLYGETTVNATTSTTTTPITSATYSKSFELGTEEGKLADADYTFTVRVTDLAGKTSEKTRSITIDTVKPTIDSVTLSGASISGSAWYKTQAIPLVVTANDSGSGITAVEYATLKASETTNVDSKWTSLPLKTEGYSGSAIFEDIGPNQQIFIRVKDNAGNVTYFKENNAATLLSIDTTAPDITPPANNSYATNGRGDNITVTGTASDAQSGLKNVVVTVGGLDNYSETITSFAGSETEKSWTATIPVSNFAANTTGNFTIYAKATNNADLAGSQVSVGSITVDTASPTITITSPVANAKVGDSFTIGGTATDGTGTGLSDTSTDKIILYYTKSPELGDVTIAPTTVTPGSNVTSSWVALDSELTTDATWTTTKTISTTVAANDANTDVYFMASVKDNAGNIGYSVPRKVTVDRKMPEVDEEPDGFGDSNAWVNRSTITFAGSFTDEGGSGANTIYYLIGDEIDNAHQPGEIPTTDGHYNTNITVDTNGENVHVHIWAEDKAGNNFINTITAVGNVKTLPTTDSDNHKMYTVKLDSSAPTLESMFFKKGENGALTATLDSAYVTGNTTITLYGNYKDGANESGVDKLTFKNNGTAFEAEDITVTYSTTEITNTDSIRGATFAAYDEANKNAYNSWKAVFSVNGSNNRITAEGIDIAGNAVAETVLDIKVDTAAPVVTITSPTGNTTKTGYDSLTIGGTVSDGTGSGLSNDDIKVYYTKDSTEGSATSITTLDTSKWTHFGTMSSAAAWTFTNANIDITYPGTIASDAANTNLYFTVEATDKAGNVGYSAPCKIVIDRKKPTLKTGKVNGVDDTSEAWMSNTSLNIEGEFTDTHDSVTGSGVSMVYWRIGAVSSSNPGTGLPTTDGKYNTIIDMPDGSSTLYIWAKDAAGNISSEQPYSVNIDGSAPTVDVKYYKKGSTGTLTQAAGTVYVNDETVITLYGNYKDEQSGVQALKFEREGTDITSNVTVTYSTTAIETDGTVPADSTYKAHSTFITDTANTTNTIRSWKAVYTPGASGAGRLTVEGKNRSSLNKVATAFDIVVDTDYPVPSFTSHTSSSVVNGNVRLAGSVTDESNTAITAISLTATSGTNTKEFAYPAVLGKGTITYANGQWSIASSDFDTTELYNGVTSPTTANLTLTLTATDAAGNTGTGTLSLKIDQNEDRPVVKFTNISNEGTDAAPQYILKYGTNASLEGTVSDDDATSAAVVKKFLVSSSPITSSNLTGWTESSTEPGTWIHATYGTTKFNKATGDYTYTPANTGDGPKNIYFYVKDNDDKEFYTAYATGTSAVLYRPFQQYKTSAKVSNDAVLTYKSDSNAPTINSVQMQAWKNGTSTATSDKSGDLMSLGENCTVGGSIKNYVDIRVSAKDANGVKGIVIKVENGDTVTYYRSNSNVSAEGVTTYVDTGTVVATSSDSTNHEYTTSRINITNFAHGSKKVTVRVYDNSGLYNNQETVFEVDRNAPNVIIDSPSDETGLYGSNGVQDASVTVRGHSDSDAVKVYMAVKGYTNASSPNTADTPDETDYEQISKSVGTSWNAIFNGKKGTASTTDFFEERFNTWVDEIYGTGTSTDTSVTEKKLRLYFYAEDAMGNKGKDSPSTLDLTIYTQGDRPTIEIASPEKPKTVNGTLTPATVGGTITITGSTTIALSSVQDIWLQIDPSYETSFNASGWESELSGLLTGKTVDYSIENTNIVGIGKAIKANGSKASWNLAINSAGEFNTTGNNNRTIAVRAYAVSATGKVSSYDELYFILDPSAPVFGQRKDTNGKLVSPLRLVQFTNNEAGTGDEEASILYEPDLWLSGKWWLKGSVSDDSGIAALKLDGTSVLSNCESYTVSGKTNYEMKIPLTGDGEYNKKLEATEQGSSAKKAEQSIILNFDNTAPQFSSNLSASGNQIVQDHGVYEMSGSFTDPDGSGFKRIAFYVTRTINGVNYLADIMKEQGNSIEANSYILNGANAESGITHVSNNTESLDTDLYWKQVTNCTTQNDREILVARTEANLKFIRKGSLCRINDVIYRINNVEAIEGNTTQLKLTIDSKVQNATTVTVDFALAQVIDNTVTENGTTESYDRTYDIDPATFEEGEESKINETKFSNDDGDQMVEAYRSSSGEWNVSINSQNIKDGLVTIHFVAYDKAGNAIHKSYQGTVSNNAPRIAGVKFGTDVNGDDDVSNNEMKETYSGLYNTQGLHKVDGITENGLASNGNKIQKLALPNNNKDVTKINNNADPIMSVKGKIKIIPEIVGGNNGLGWKWAVGTYESGYTLLNNAIHSGTTDVRDDDTTEFVVDTTALLNPQVGLSDGPQVFTFTISDKTGTTLGDSNCGKAELLLKLNVALHDGDNPTAGIEPFYWRTNSAGVLENSLYYEGTGSSKKVKGHIELPEDLPSTTFKYKNGTTLVTGEYDMDPKVSGIIYLEGFAKDNVVVEELALRVTEGSTTGSWVTVAKRKRAGDTSAPSGTANGAFYATTTLESSTGIKFESATEKTETTDGIDYNVVNWKIAIDTSKIAANVAGTDIKIEVQAKDRKLPSLSNGTVSYSGDQRSSELSTLQTGLKQNATGTEIDYTNNTLTFDSSYKTPYYKVDVVPYITGVSTELSAGNKKRPTVLSRSALGVYPVRRGSNITVEGFNLNGTSSRVQIGTQEYTPITGTTTNSLVITTDANTTSSGIVAKTGNITSLNNQTAKSITTGAGNNAVTRIIEYNTEPNGQNNDILTDKRELYVVDVYTTTDKEDKRMLDMSINGNNINFSAGYKDAYFSVMMGASGTSVGTISNLRNSYTRYFDNAIAVNDSGTPFTVSACGDTLGTPVSGWDNGPSQFALRKGTANTGRNYIWEYNTISNNTTLLVLDSNWNGANLNNLDRFKWPAIAVTGTNAATKGYISYYDSTQKLIKFRYFTSTTNTVASNLASYRNGSTATQYVEGAVNTNATYSQGYTAIAGANENSAYSAVGVTSDGAAVVTWYDAANGALKMKYNTSPADSFSGFQTFKTVPTAGTVTFKIAVDGGTAKDASVTFANPTYGDAKHEFAYQLNLVLSNGYGAYAEVNPKSNLVTVYSMQTGTSSSISITKLSSGEVNNAVAGAGAAWNEVPIDDDSAGQYVAEKTDSKGGIHFAYYDTGNGDLKYAYISSVTATPVVVTVDGYQQVGQYVDLALKETTSGTTTSVIPYISYYSMSNADTKRAAKVAKLVNPITYTTSGSTVTANTTTIPQGSVDELFTGDWEAMHIPTNGIPVQYRVNIGVTSGGTVYVSYLADRIIEYVKVE